MKTVQCPSCGAAATNSHNCDFCGSLFVRFEELNISTNKVISKDNNFIGFIFQGLKEELTKNLLLQNNENWQVTDVMLNDAVIIQVVASKGLQNLLKTTNPSFPGLAIHLPFMDDREFEHDKFIKLEESKLFKHTYDSELDCHDYVIDFGNDAEGAAYLVSKILIEVEGIDESSKLNYDTSDYKDSNNSKEGACFIATATMGSYNHPTVLQLRNFRDNWILNKSWGASFVKWYYHYGAIVAARIENRRFIRIFCYIIIIKPLHFLSKLLIK